MAAEVGLPSCTDFWVVGASAADFTEQAGPGELIADIGTFNTRHGVLHNRRVHYFWAAMSSIVLECLFNKLSCPMTVPRSASLLCCGPRTGRTHQIRVHVAHAGHAIIGDEVYGLKACGILLCHSQHDSSM